MLRAQFGEEGEGRVTWLSVLTCGPHMSVTKRLKTGGRVPVCLVGLLLGHTARAREEERGKGLGGLGQKRAWLVFLK